MTKAISYQINGPIFEIHIDNPISLNSFTIAEFTELAALFIKSDNEPSTKVTLITSTGDFFSTGVNIKTIAILTEKSRLEYYDMITSKTMYLVNTILSHQKIIFVALNGPVIGLSAALVSLMDVIYGRPEGKPYIQFPFSTIGLVNEGGISASLPYRIGVPLSIEALSLAKKIQFDRLVHSGYITNVVSGTTSTHEFNEKVREDVTKSIKNLAVDSMNANKKMIRDSFNYQVNKQIVDESFEGLQRWMDERPQSAFKRMSKKSRL